MITDGGFNHEQLIELLVALAADAATERFYFKLAGRCIDVRLKDRPVECLGVAQGIVLGRHPRGLDPPYDFSAARDKRNFPHAFIKRAIWLALTRLITSMSSKLEPAATAKLARSATAISTGLFVRIQGVQRSE